MLCVVIACASCCYASISTVVVPLPVLIFWRAAVRPSKFDSSDNFEILKMSQNVRG